jgi:hypothetical protein
MIDNTGMLIPIAATGAQHNSWFNPVLSHDLEWVDIEVIAKYRQPWNYNGCPYNDKIYRRPEEHLRHPKIENR